MEVCIRAWQPEDMGAMLDIWNEVVEDGTAFPQVDRLNGASGMSFFSAQSFTGVACGDAGSIVGLYILHPNNVGRCGHICNASFAVKRGCRGEGIGELLVSHCIAKARELNFGILQFNAVVSSNNAALALYRKLGFKQLGVIPGGFLMKNGGYEDIIPHYLPLRELPREGSGA